MTRKKLLFCTFAVFVAFVFINNTNLFFSSDEQGNTRALMAHRGVHQNFHYEQMGNDTCTASRILEPNNTIPSMRAAFDAGADIVELDVKITKDKKLAVFHDDTLDCRTNASGKPWQFTMSELRALDIAYGYTADQGKTFPLRGQGVGMMPSLNEVLDTFPNKPLLINFKTRNPLNADLLVELLEDRSAEQNSKIMVYGGGGAPTERLKELMPEIRSFTRETVKACLTKYLVTSWTGVVPQECKDTAIMVPNDYAWMGLAGAVCAKDGEQ